MGDDGTKRSGSGGRFSAMGQEGDLHDMNISLPKAQRDHAEACVASGLFGSVSEYITELIRRDQRDSGHRRLEKALIEGLDSGPAEPFSEGFFDRQRQRIRKTDSNESQAS